MNPLVGHPLVAALGLLLDRLLPEPAQHPLALFGRYAGWLERRLNRPGRPDNRNRGIWALMAAVLPATALGVGLQHLPFPAAEAASLVVVVLALGGHSLAVHGRAVATALADGDLAAARHATAMLVSRDTAELDAAGCARATTESMLENGNDAVIGTLFWFLIAGIGGVVAYRLVNTLDAMWGYRSERYRLFGWAAARLDDTMNFLPARLTAAGYTLLGHRRPALRAWREDAPAWESPNAGPVMAAGAGALGLTLGGPARYRGRLHRRPWLGRGRRPAAGDIDRAVALVQRTAILVVLIAVGVWALA